MGRSCRDAGEASMPKLLALQGVLHAIVSLLMPYRAVLNLQGVPTLQFTASCQPHRCRCLCNC